MYVSTLTLGLKHKIKAFCNYLVCYNIQLQNAKDFLETLTKILSTSVLLCQRMTFIESLFSALLLDLKGRKVSVCTSHSFNMSRDARKPDNCLCENKGADQLRGCEADQRLCFCYSDSTFPPLLNSKISSF